MVKECPQKTKKILDFRDAKVPHFINIFAQVSVIQVNIYTLYILPVKQSNMG